MLDQKIFVYENLKYCEIGGLFNNLQLAIDFIKKEHQVMGCFLPDEELQKMEDVNENNEYDDYWWCNLYVANLISSQPISPTTKKKINLRSLFLLRSRPKNIYLDKILALQQGLNDVINKKIPKRQLGETKERIFDESWISQIHSEYYHTPITNFTSLEKYIEDSNDEEILERMWDEMVVNRSIEPNHLREDHNKMLYW